jgi:hypothetical protein
VYDTGVTDDTYHLRASHTFYLSRTGVSAEVNITLLYQGIQQD